jgi:hypothetical protein
VREISEIRVSEEGTAISGVNLLGFRRRLGFVEDTQLNCFFDG